MPVFLEAETADHFYNGYCNNVPWPLLHYIPNPNPNPSPNPNPNQVLWPLLHYIPLSMLDAQAQLTETQWEAYQRANQAFADTVPLPPPCNTTRPRPQPCVAAEGCHY